MGEAQRKLLKASERVTFDASKIKFHLTKGTRISLAMNQPEPGEAQPDPSPERVYVRAFRSLVVNLINSAFPQGVGTTDGKVWGAWREALDEACEMYEGPEDRPTTFPVTRAQLDWLKKHLEDDKTRVHPDLAQWRDVAGDYFTELSDTPADPLPISIEAAESAGG